MRERLVGWLRTQDEAGLPRQRVLLVGHGDERPEVGGEAGPGDRPGLFSGDARGEARGEHFRRQETAD